MRHIIGKTHFFQLTIMIEFCGTRRRYIYNQRSVKKAIHDDIGLLFYTQAEESNFINQKIPPPLYWSYLNPIIEILTFCSGL